MNNRTLLTQFLVSLSLELMATECVDRTFKEESLNLYLCQNYSNYNETRTLLYKTREEILDEYIREKIKSGELLDKKFQIQVYDQLLSSEHLNISQGKTDFFVSFSGFATIQQLKTFIDYFANKNWTPFFTGDFQKSSGETISKQIDKFFEDNSTSALNLTKANVWILDKLSLDYVNDTLKYVVNSIQLDIDARSNLPIKIHDRFLLFQTDAIFVVQGQEIIKSFNISNPIAEDFYIYTFNKWVNICNGGSDNWLYAYSYDKNCFYARPE